MILPFENSLSGRRVLVTGHTGFKGGWLSMWLKEIGADVAGISLAPNTEPNLFEAAKIENITQHHILDIGEEKKLSALVEQIKPEVAFHLAAQPLVRYSYDHPIETFRTNALGTAHVLEACRQAGSVSAIVSVTTDKVYRNLEQITPYVESSELGGHDPYSASKVAAEFVSASYRDSFFAKGSGTSLATARGGNVIGGGDWSQDRLIVDIVRALISGEKLSIRNPDAVRPWQHVLALCHGYLQLADALLTQKQEMEGAWNFGPDSKDMISVRTIVEMFGRVWEKPLLEETAPASTTKHETQLLMLDCEKARTQLQWKPAWDLNTALEKTADWYKHHAACPEDGAMITRRQISEYRAAISG